VCSKWAEALGSAGEGFGRTFSAAFGYGRAQCSGEVNQSMRMVRTEEGRLAPRMPALPKILPRPPSASPSSAFLCVTAALASQVASSCYTLTTPSCKVRRS
jgi:hypothetical protein